MAAGHLVADADLTLLGDVDLGYLHDARGQLVADGDVELLAAELGVDFLALAEIVDDRAADEVVLVLVAGPVGEAEAVIVDGAEDSGAELGALGHDFRTEEVEYAARGQTLGEDEELVDKYGEECVLLFFVLFVEFGKEGISALVLLFLGGAAEEVRADYHTLERGRSLEGGVLDIAGLVAEDGTEKFFLGSGVGLALRRNLTDHDVAGHDVRTHADDAALVEIACGVLADVGDVGSEFLHTALGLAHFERIFVDVYRGEDIVADDALVQHDGVLIVVTLPGHECHLEVAAESEFALLGGVALGEDVAGVDALSLVADRTEVDGRALVGLAPLGKSVLLDGVLESDEFVFLGAVIADSDDRGVDELDDTGAFGHDLGAAVAGKLGFDARTYDRSLRTHQRHGLAHHVRSHECAVGVVVLEEGNERCGYRGNLCGRYVHELDFRRRNYREVSVLTGLDLVADEGAVVVEGRVALGYHLAFLNLGGEIYDVVVVEVDTRVLDLAVRGLDEAEVVDLGVYAERADKTDVRAFRGLDRTETAVVGVVHVSHLESRALTRQTAGAEGRHTALVGDFGQRVGLVHELRQGVGAEEGVDDRRYRLGVDEVGGGEHLVVADVHALADGAAHAAEADAELVVELLAHGAHAAVRQVVDIVDVGTGVDELDEVADDGYDVLLGEHTHIGRDGKVELAVDAIAAYLAEIIALLGEEEVGDDFARRSVVWRLGVAELPVYILDGLLFGVSGIFLESVEDDGVVGGTGILLVEEYARHTRSEDCLGVVLGDDCLSVDNYFVALESRYFTGIVVAEFLCPRLEDTGGELAADGFPEIGLVDLHLLGQAEDVDDLLIAFKTDSAEKRGHGELLLAVDVSVHHVVDVSGELNPRTAERYDTARIELGAVGMGALSEEHTGAAVELRNDNAFGTIDDERTLFGHVGNLPEVYRLDFGGEVLMVGIGAGEFQLCLQRHTV